MKNETPTGDRNNSPSPMEYLAKQVTVLKAIVSGLVALLVVAFGAGVLWSSVLGYEQRVNKLQDDLAKLTAEINQFKSNIGQLGDPSYETEVTNDSGGARDSGGVRCERGNVVSGARYDEEHHRMWIRCASISRAVWNPFAGGQGQAPK